MRKTLLNRSGAYFAGIMAIILAMLTAMSPLAIDTYLAAMPTMAKYFDVGVNMIEISLTLYYLGFALGNFLGGPLSDSFGRKRIALTGVLLYGISALTIPYCPNIHYIWALRMIQAFGGGFASVTVMVFVRDWFEGKQVARLATIISMIMMLAPLFAPLLGSVFLHYYGWKAIFIFLTFYAVLIFFIFYFLMPESRKKELITKKVTQQQLFGNYKIFFSHPRAVLMLFTISFSMAGMFTFITGSSFLYLEFFKFDKHFFPFLFGANVILNVTLSILNTKLLKRYEPEQILKLGLVLQLISGIFLFAIVQLQSPAFLFVFLAIVLYIGSLGMIFGNGVAIILNLLPKISGSANAAIGVTRFIISFIVGTIPALLNTGDLVPLGVVMFLCALISNLFFYFFSRAAAKTKSCNSILVD